MGCGGSPAQQKAVILTAVKSLRRSKWESKGKENGLIGAISLGLCAAQAALDCCEHRSFPVVGSLWEKETVSWWNLSPAIAKR